MGTGLRSASTVAVAMVTALLGSLLISSSVLAIKGTEAWGWVVARQPSTTQYTPAARDQATPVAARIASTALPSGTTRSPSVAWTRRTS